MESFDATGGIAHAVQVIDSTGIYIIDTGLSETGAAFSNALYEVDQYGEQIPVETLKDRLASIRRKSHAELGEAWSKLAQM